MEAITEPVDNAEDAYHQELDVSRERAKMGLMTFFRAAEVGGLPGDCLD